MGQHTQASTMVCYVAGGGALTAQVSFTNISRSSLRGRGVLFDNLGGGILIQNASEITVQDVIILNPDGYKVLTGLSGGVSCSPRGSFVEHSRHRFL